MKTFLIFASFTVLLAPAASAGQAGLPSTGPDLPKWDVAVGFGGLYRTDTEWNKRTPQEVESSAALAAVPLTLGRYWTPHLKTDVTFTVPPGEFGLFDFETVPVSGLPEGGYVFTDKTYRVQNLAVGGTYQFRENAFVHPFVSAGVQIEWLHVHRFRDEKTYRLNTGSGNTTVSYTVPALDQRYTDPTPYLFVSGGGKFYFNRRVFVKPEIVVATGDVLREWLWCVGFGGDF